MHGFNKFVYKEKFVMGQNWLLILENQGEIMLSYANEKHPSVLPLHGISFKDI